MLIIITAGIYLALGLLFAIAFIIKGVHIIDEESVSTPIGFRLLIFPGSVLLWPFLLRNWMNKR
jgi:hypothetical protein